MLSDLLPNDKSPNPLLTRQIVDQICQFIQERHLAVGEKIPTEFELAQLFRVGRGTIREAVKLLISRNILEIRRGKGTFVCENPGVVDDPFGFIYQENKIQLVADLIRIRYILEPEIAALAAEHATSEEINRMKNMADAIEILAQENRDFSDDDIALHTLIATCSRNMVMPNLIPVIHFGIDLYNHSVEKYETLKALSFHMVIINAIEAHSPEDARIAMQEHLEYNRKNVHRPLNSRSSGKIPPGSPGHPDC
ncbi:GntR family transcriptional regulator [Spirochaetia bacterium]|nr:GntR family transcriptional regulator [Spirochaetia bacterium]